MVGVFVRQGEAALSADGTLSGGPATFTLAVDGPDGRYYFDQPGSLPFTTTAIGGVALQLPLFAHGLLAGWRHHSGPGWERDSRQRVCDPNPRLLAALQGDTDSVMITTPNLSSLIPPSFNLASSASMLAEGLGQLFSKLQDCLSSRAFVNALPIIGSQLGKAVQFFRDLAVNPVAHLRSLVDDAVAAGVQMTAGLLQQDLFQVLGPNAAGVLGDRNDDGRITADDVSVVLDTSHVEFGLRLKQQTDLGTSFSFLSGLSCLGLSLQGSGGVSLAAGYSLDVVVGMDQCMGSTWASPPRLCN